MNKENKTSAAQLKASKKYNDKATDLIAIRLQKAAIVNKNSIKEWAKNANMSVNKYIVTAILEKHEREIKE